MRYFLAIAMLLCAVPTFAASYYVNAGDTRARNLPAAQGYGTVDSPWITPTYAIAQSGGNTNAHDTIYIYGYSFPDAPQDTDNYYLDALVMGTKYVDLVGISDKGCSPTFSRGVRTGEQYPYYWTAASNTTYFIKNIRFYNIGSSNSYFYGVYFEYIASSITYGAVIDGCIFDSMFSTAYGDGKMGAVSAFNNTSTTPFNVAINNCAFVNMQNMAAAFTFSNNSYEPVVTMSNCTVRGCSAAVSVHSNGARLDTPVIATNSIFANNDYVYFYDDNAQNDTMNTVTSYTDTYLTKSLGNMTPLGYQLFTNIYTINPEFAALLNGDTVRYCYLSQTAPDTVTKGSASGGLIGVLWAWSETVTHETVSLRYVHPFCSIYRRLLWGR